MKKSQNMPVRLNKMVLTQHFLRRILRLSEKAQHSLLLSLVHWLDSLIGPGGWVLVVCHLFAVPEALV
jgi:hypothetical protein